MFDVGTKPLCRNCACTSFRKWIYTLFIRDNTSWEYHSYETSKYTQVDIGIAVALFSLVALLKSHKLEHAHFFCWLSGPRHRGKYPVYHTGSTENHWVYVSQGWNHWASIWPLTIVVTLWDLWSMQAFCSASTTHRTYNTLRIYRLRRRQSETGDWWCHFLQLNLICNILRLILWQMCPTIHLY